MAPNVLLIVLDTARADAFEPYGAPSGTTPVVAELAARGVALPDVRATSCWTIPSHASMFTGLMPREAGLSRAPGEALTGCRPVMEAHSHRLLPVVLGRAGYRTRGVSTNISISRASGFATGFEEFVDVPPARAPGMSSPSRGARARWAYEALQARRDDGAGAAGAQLRDWFESAGGEPNFWFVNLIEAHSPYLPPKPWNDLGPLDRLRAAEEARRHLTAAEIWRVCVSEFDVPHDALERMRHLYACSIRQLDAWLGDVLSALEANGLLDTTLVIVCSDHGENFGEGGLLGHAYSLDERLVRVPFAASGPGAPEQLVSLLEIPRAVARAAGIAKHPWDEEPTEVAVAQFDPPGTDDDPRRRRAVEQWRAGPGALARLSARLDCAVQGDAKLLRVGDDLALLDLAADPLEESPRTIDRDQAPPALLAAIEDQAGAVAAAVDADPRAASPEEVARIEDQMRTLGYL